MSGANEGKFVREKRILHGEMRCERCGYPYDVKFVVEYPTTLSVPKVESVEIHFWCANCLEFSKVRITKQSGE